jgi:hypothetical protein
MIRQCLLFFSCLPILLCVQMARAQTGTLSGYITDSTGTGIQGVTIIIPQLKRGVASDSLGFYSITIPADSAIMMILTHVNYQDRQEVVAITSGEEKKLDMVMRHKTRILDQVEIRPEQEEMLRQQASLTFLEPKNVAVMPGPFSDIGRLLATLPGVISNNELSGTYSVRGGNFEENLIYVNEIPVYRPFLIRAGEQEGLSFVNMDLASSVEFSSGGWAPEYGDKLSSSLNVTYKKPQSWKASAMLSLLGGSLHLEGVNKKRNLSFLAGFRQKRTEYLLNTLETEGEYFPRFTDFQTYLSAGLGKPEADGSYRTDLGILFSYANNRYQVVPESRETTFGTFDRPLNLFVAFLGQEIMTYNTFQAGIKLTHRFSAHFISKLIISDFRTTERENFDVEAGYRICDVDKQPGSASFNQCITLRGIGTDYESARNLLDGNVINAESKNEIILNPNNRLEFGTGYSFQQFNDQLHEYSFVDSADYVNITELIKAENQTRGNQFTAYVQHNSSIRDQHTITYGLRFNYFDLNDQLLVSPRIQYAFTPRWERDVVFRSAVGLYQQPPLYRELRNFEGEVDESVKAQSAIHFITGLDYNFLLWGRPFKFMAEAYYKKMADINPYDIDNVRIRYYAVNNARAYAAGLDFRISGEFIPGDESWFSLGLLTAREDLYFDDRGWIPRPSDQLVNFNIFFQDHIPNAPTYRVYLNLNFASGLPFGPPGNLESRNIFRGDSYQRVDIGFSKIFYLKVKLPESIWLGLEILNLTGRSNQISYYWVRDFQNTYYGVPNSLTTRFFNIKFIAKF